MGAPTSGLICGRKDLVRACYLQNWGIGRAMKVGKEGIAGLMVAMESWYGGGEEERLARYRGAGAVLRERLPVEDTCVPHQIVLDLGRPARPVANLLREGDPPLWVHEAEGTRLTLDLRVLG